ncbi:MAG: nonstructural protein [Arizlama microvirus]|nr:MAG: nonstructural protein [Arizlama microvirus]
MEQHKVFLFKDAKSLTYGPPFVEQNKGMVIRAIQEQLQQGQAVWAKHPQDFTLFEIGDFDPTTGIVQMHETKVAIGLVQDFKISLDN